MYFGHGFDSRLVHSESGLNTGFEPLDFLKALKKVLKHNFELTKGEKHKCQTKYCEYVRTHEAFFFYAILNCI